MNEWGIILILTLVGIGFFYVGVLHGSRHDLFWRLQWIKLEHQLAALQQRKPRNIEEVEPK